MGDQVSISQDGAGAVFAYRGRDGRVSVVMPRRGMMVRRFLIHGLSRLSRVLGFAIDDVDVLISRCDEEQMVASMRSAGLVLDIVDR